MSEKKTERFTLGVGTVYAARGRVDERALESETYRTGDTDGACTLVYDYKTKELLDVEGKSAGILRYAEKVTVKGKIRRLTDAGMKTVLEGGEMLSVLLVCPLPGGDSFRLHLKGGVCRGVSFGITDGGGMEFEFTCRRGLVHPRLSLAMAGGASA